MVLMEDTVLADSSVLSKTAVQTVFIFFHLETDRDEVQIAI